MKKNNEIIENFNPKLYKRIAIVFATLSLINLIVVTFAFNRTGYGLYYAEEAVSSIAKIQNYLQTTNESVLNIVIHKNDITVIDKEITNVHETFQNIDKEAEHFKSIDVSNINESIKDDFEDSMQKIDKYHSALLKHSEEFRSYNQEDPESKEKLSAFTNQIEEWYETEIDPLKDDATLSIENIFENQSKSTYDFFIKVAQSFLILVVFMLFTMAVGLNSIAYMKKTAKKSAIELQKKNKTAIEKAREASNFHQKAVAIAYTNILTGMKNRYALEEDLHDRLKTEDLTIALFSFDNFNQLNEVYGRSFGDKFLTTVSDSLSSNFSEQFHIYQTNTEEFCFVSRKNTERSDADAAIQKIINILSESFQVSALQIQQPFSGCIYHYSSRENIDINSLFVKLDKTISDAKRTSGNKVLDVKSMYF